MTSGSNAFRVAQEDDMTSAVAPPVLPSHQGSSDVMPRHTEDDKPSSLPSNEQIHASGLPRGIGQASSQIQMQTGTPKPFATPKEAPLQAIPKNASVEESLDGLRPRLRKGCPVKGCHVAGDEKGDRPRLATWQDWAVRCIFFVLLLLTLSFVVFYVQLHQTRQLFTVQQHPILRPMQGSQLTLTAQPTKSATEILAPQWSIRSACNTREQAMLQHFFRTIVLVINTNYKDVAYGTADFLRSVYGRFFEQIVIISPDNLPDIKVEARGHKYWRGQWMFSYFHLPKVMAKYPLAEGFLWINDDVALNYWMLLGANKSRLWLTNDLAHADSRFFPFSQYEKALKKEYESDWAGTKESRDGAWKSFDSLDEQYQKQYQRSILPLSNMYPKRIADVFYIPRRFVHQVSYDLIPVFREFKVWSEIAVPMMFYALDSPENFDHVLDDMVIIWNRDKYDPLQHWLPNVSALHPWKLMHSSSKVVYLKTLGSVDACLLGLLDKFSAEGTKS